MSVSIRKSLKAKHFWSFSLESESSEKHYMNYVVRKPVTSCSNLAYFDFELTSCKLVAQKILFNGLFNRLLPMMICRSARSPTALLVCDVLQW